MKTVYIDSQNIYQGLLQYHGVNNSSVLLKKVAKSNILDLSELKIKLKKEKPSNKI